MAMQGSGQSIGIIADDLTGACDTALQFHLGGANTTVLLDPGQVQSGVSAQVWVVNTDSRHLSPTQAAAKVTEALGVLKKTIGVERYYKKMDSVLRGHIVPECRAAIDMLGCKATVIAPAYPEEGRRTVGGYQIIRGFPVSQTEVIRDPLFPVRESHIPTLLAQSAPQEEIGYLPLSTILDGAGPIRTALLAEIQRGKKFIVADACSNTDLDQLSLAMAKMPDDMPVLPCGSAGLAKALGHRWLSHDMRTQRPHAVVSRMPLLYVVGSTSHITQEQARQLDTYCNTPDTPALALIKFTPGQILGRDPVDVEIAQIIAHLVVQRNVMITTSFSPEMIDHTLLLAGELAMTPLEASVCASQLLANVTRAVLAQAQAGLVVSGGETAHAVCRAIDMTTLHLVDAIEPSIPLMIDAQARWLVTKSGSFGTPQSFIAILQALGHSTTPNMAASDIAAGV